MTSLAVELALLKKKKKKKKTTFPLYYRPKEAVTSLAVELALLKQRVCKTASMNILRKDSLPHFRRLVEITFQLGVASNDKVRPQKLFKFQ